MCFVDFHHFVRFADYWLETGSDIPADLYEDENNIVNVNSSLKVAPNVNKIFTNEEIEIYLTK